MPCLVFNSLSSRHRPWAPAWTAHILGWQVYAPYPSYCACVWLQPIPWGQVLIFPLLVLCFEVLYSDAQPGLKSKKLGKWLKLQINSFIEWNLSVYIQTPLNAVPILNKEIFGHLYKDRSWKIIFCLFCVLLFCITVLRTKSKISSMLDNFFFLSLNFIPGNFACSFKSEYCFVALANLVLAV